VRGWGGVTGIGVGSRRNTSCCAEGHRRGARIVEIVIQRRTTPLGTLGCGERSARRVFDASMKQARMYSPGYRPTPQELVEEHRRHAQRWDLAAVASDLDGTVAFYVGGSEEDPYEHRQIPATRERVAPGFVIGTMAMVPVLFIILPMIPLFTANVTRNTANLNLPIGLSLLYVLVIPVMVPSVVSAYSVVGEREQGTLEPVLITPIRPEEFLIGKALAAFVPTLVIAYAVFGIFLGAAALFAHPVIVSAIYAGTHVLVILALMSLNVIKVSTALALGLAAALLAVDLLAWRVVAAMFDRERLVTGTRG
jgi:ABC-2 type transport system permease protein